MLTIFHAPMSRSTRIVWLCEEMGVPYQTEPASLQNPTPALLAINPLRTAPAFVDGDVRMTESIAIMLYITGKYGPTPLAPAPADPGYGDFLQYLIFGEASLAMYAQPALVARFIAHETEKSNWSVQNCLERLVKRMELIDTQLHERPYIAGERFTAADISVGYALGLSGFLGLDDKIPARATRYLAGLRERPAFKRAIAKT